MKLQKLVAAFLVAVLGCSVSNGAILVADNFDRADGDLVGTDPTPGPGSTWAAHSGAGAKAIQISSGSITLEQSSGSGEDVNSDWGTAVGAGDIVYAGFDLTLTGSVDFDGYFAHFKTSGSFFNSRVSFAPAVSGGDYTLALSGDGNITDADGEAIWASDLAFGTTYRVIHSYNYDTGEKSMWIDPVDAMSTSITATDSAFSDPMVQYAFRQTSGSSLQQIDNLVVATTFAEALGGTNVPEPSSILMALMSVSAAGAVSMRRRLG